MTRKKDNKIAKCGACGKMPKLNPSFYDSVYWIDCSYGHCWSGPERKTKAGAINAWNRIMKQGRFVNDQ